MLPNALPRRLLADIAAGLARAEDLWAPCRTNDLSERPSVRLLSTERYEAWLLQWDVGHSVDLHDHGGSAGALIVVEGELVEVTSLADGAVIRRTLTRHDRRTFAPNHVHDVLNLGPTPAASIHVYSPPLTSMTFYDAVSRRPLRREPVDAGPAPVLPRETARALHPTMR